MHFTAGTFPGLMGNFTGCLYPCPVGYYGDSPHLTAPSGVDGCIPCDQRAGFTTDGPGAASAGDCGCRVGYYEYDTTKGNRTCVECPTGADCDSVNTRLEDLPVKPGWWRQHSDSPVLRQCFGVQDVAAAVCLGGTNVTTQCAVGQSGPYCAVCDDGFYGGELGERCRSCDGSLLLTFVPAIVLGGLALISALYGVHRCWRDKGRGGHLVGLTSPLVTAGAGAALAQAAPLRQPMSQQPSASLGRCVSSMRQVLMPGVKGKMIISLYQMLSGIGPVFSIPFPPSFRVVVQSTRSVIEIDLTRAMPLSCINAFRGFLPVLLVRTLLPLSLILGLALAAQLTKASRPAVSEMCSTGWFFLVFLVYPGCARASPRPLPALSS